MTIDVIWPNMGLTRPCLHTRLNNICLAVPANTQCFATAEQIHQIYIFHWILLWYQSIHKNFCNFCTESLKWKCRYSDEMRLSNIIVIIFTKYLMLAVKKSVMKISLNDNIPASGLELCISIPNGIVQWQCYPMYSSIYAKSARLFLHQSWYFTPWTSQSTILNTQRPRKNGHQFPNNNFKWLISIKKSVLKGLINNIPALVQIIAWHWPGDKPLSEPMHIRVTQPQWVNTLLLTGSRQG